MRNTLQILFTIGLLLIIGCQDSGTESVGLSDAELIQAIIDADKIDIDMGELPSKSKTLP